MENISVQEFKEMMRKGMIENYETDGEITPILFFLKDGKPHFVMIPPELFASPEGKYTIAQIIKNICVQPNVIAAGMIIEAFGAVIDNTHENAEDIISGNKKISEIDERKDIIAMVFSTPESEELIAYEVNEVTKEVGEQFGKNEDGTTNGGLSGLFSGFFNWNKN